MKNSGKESRGSMVLMIAGEELLQFCALTVMNTWFEKKTVYFDTWVQPATKLSHMIDHVVVRAGQIVYCKNVRVMRGANCWTDHMLVRAKLKIGFPHIHSRVDRKKLPFSVHKLSSSASQEDFNVWNMSYRTNPISVTYPLMIIGKH